MMRIHITGNAGSGKTSLANELGEILGMNVYGLDKIVWGEGWTVTPSNERRSLENELVMKSEWIIEGVSSVVRQAADIVVFLDFPRYVCFQRCGLRALRFLFSTRPELPANCPEIKIIPKLTKIVWQFPSIAKQIIVSDLSKKESIIITTEDELRQLVEDIKLNRSVLSDVSRRGLRPSTVRN